MFEFLKRKKAPEAETSSSMEQAPSNQNAFGSLKGLKSSDAYKQEAQHDLETNPEEIARRQKEYDEADQQNQNTAAVLNKLFNEQAELRNTEIKELYKKMLRDGSHSDNLYIDTECTPGVSFSSVCPAFDDFKKVFQASTGLHVIGGYHKGNSNNIFICIKLKL